MKNKDLASHYVFEVKKSIKENPGHNLFSFEMNPDVLSRLKEKFDPLVFENIIREEIGADVKIEEYGHYFIVRGKIIPSYFFDKRDVELKCSDRDVKINETIEFRSSMGQ